jgi:hypothetical protein
MRQSVPVLHLKQGDAAKSYCLNVEIISTNNTIPQPQSDFSNG